MLRRLSAREEANELCRNLDRRHVTILARSNDFKMTTLMDYMNSFTTCAPDTRSHQSLIEWKLICEDFH